MLIIDDLTLVQGVPISFGDADSYLVETTDDNLDLYIAGSLGAAFKTTGIHTPLAVYTDTINEYTASAGTNFSTKLWVGTPASTLKGYCFSLVQNTTAGASGFGAAFVGDGQWTSGLADYLTADATYGYRPRGNIGIQAVASIAHATQTNLGQMCLTGKSSGTNIAAWYSATISTASAKNIGMVAMALNTGTSGIEIGGFVGLYNSGAPNFATSAGFIVDNGAQTCDILVLRDNNTDVFNVADGGNVTMTGLLNSVGLSNGSIYIAATKSLSFNGSGGTTFVSETSTGYLQFTVNSQIMFSLDEVNNLVILGDTVEMEEQDVSSWGTPASGKGWLGIDSADSKLKFKSDAGTLYDLTDSGSGVVWGTASSTYIVFGAASGAIQSSANLAWNGTYYSLDVWTDSNNYNRILPAQNLITIAGTDRMLLAPDVSDGASAVAYLFDTANALSTTGAKLMSIRNNGTQKFYIDKDGNAYTGAARCVTTADVYWDRSGSVVYPATTGDYISFNQSDAKMLAPNGLSGHVAGYDMILSSGNAYSTGDNNGGNFYLQLGTANGSGTVGNFYFGTGAAGHISAKSSETDIIYYNSTTGKISYGAAPSGGGVSVANQADNRLITATGTADALNAESGLQYNGTTLAVTGSITSTSNYQQTTSAAHSYITLYADTGDTIYDAFIKFQVYDGGGTSAFEIGIDAGRGDHLVISSSRGGVAMGVNAGDKIWMGALTTQTTEELYVTGSIYATDNIQAYSDIRSKSVLEYPKNVLDSLMNINPILFRFKDGYGKPDSEMNTLQYGFSAQEVMEYFPNAVSYVEEEDRYGIKMMSMTAINTMAIKEVKSEVDILRERVDELEKEIILLKNMN